MATIIDLANSIEPLTTKLLDTRLSTHGYLQVQGFFQASSEYDFKKHFGKNETLKEKLDNVDKNTDIDILLKIIDDIKSSILNNTNTYAYIEQCSKYIWYVIDLSKRRDVLECAVFDKYYLLNQNNKLVKEDKDKYKVTFLHNENYILEFVENLKQFITLVEKYSDKKEQVEDTDYEVKKTLYFRGHRNCNYNIEAYISRSPYYKNEFKIFNETQVLCSTSFEKCHTNLQTLAMMQHYEVPTRLLDISTNPLVALFFAVCAFREDFGKKLNGEVLIFAVDESKICYDDSDKVRVLSALPAIRDCDREKIIEKFNLQSNELQHSSEVQKLVKVIRKEDVRFKNEITKNLLQQCVLVKPIKNNNRMLRQSGVFFICGLSEYGSFDNAKDISEYRIKDNNKKKVVCIIPNKYKEIIYRELEHLKINNANLYPEIEHVAKYIREKYED